MIPASYSKFERKGEGVRNIELVFIKRELETLCQLCLYRPSGHFVSHHSISSPPFCWGDNFQSQILKRGRGSEKNECLAGLKEFLPWMFARERGCLPCFLSKKAFKNKIWLWGLNFKCWSLPVLAKQPINV